MDKKVSRISLPFIAFKKALKNSPAVLKILSLKFGFYFLGVGFFLIFLISVFLSEIFTIQAFSEFYGLGNILFFALKSFSYAFTLFIIPYYAYKETYSSLPAPPFWDFISRTVYPVVIAHIKATFLLLFFTLLFILPGIYKRIRWNFLNETVFFENEKPGSALKKSDQTTRSFFWTLVLFLCLTFVFSSLLPRLLGKVMLYLNVPVFIFSSLKLFIVFYLSSFVILWKTHFYFEIKKFKGEPISL